MNLSSHYNLILGNSQLIFSINWEYNFLYLKNYIDHNCLYVDSHIKLFLNNSFFYNLGSEEDFGCLLDFILDLVENKQGLIFKSHQTSVSKDLDILTLRYCNCKTLQITVDDYLLRDLTQLRNEIISDFDKMSKYLTILRQILQ